MNKKPKRNINKRIKKGGTSILEKTPIINNTIKKINRYGDFIADDIDYNIRQGKKKELIKKYEEALDEANLNVERAKEQHERNENDRKLKDQEFLNKLQQKIYKWEITKWILNTIGNILLVFTNIIGSSIKFSLRIFIQLARFSKTILSGIGKIGDLGQGVILKTIVLIIIIILIFFGINGFFGGGSGNNNKISKEGTMNSFIIKTTSPSFFGNFGKSLQNLVPIEYRITFNNFRNNFNKIIGNDLIEKAGIPRKEINTGKNDEIYHIKYPDDPDRIYTTMKPNNININLKGINDYPDIDYQKLPNNIKKLYPLTSIMTLPIETKDNKKGAEYWYYNTENMYKNLNEKDKILKTPIINTSNINEFIFNSEKAIIYDNKDNNDTSSLFMKMFKYNNNKYEYPIKEYINHVI